MAQQLLHRASAFTSLRRGLDGAEVAELCELIRHLPMLVRGGFSPARPICLPDALALADAAFWSAAARHGVDIGPATTAAEVSDRLTSAGWDKAPARDALRALAMLRASVHGRAVPAPDVEIAACEAAARLIAYLELRARYG